jgi:nicotinate-nucleotide pyrophosphorylase (carboxylating)
VVNFGSLDARIQSRAVARAPAGVTVEVEAPRAVAETGVDYISVGALTHSAPALDVSLLLEPL